MTDQKFGVREMEIEMDGDGIFHWDRERNETHFIKKLTGSNLDGQKFSQQGIFFYLDIMMTIF